MRPIAAAAAAVWSMCTIKGDEHVFGVSSLHYCCSFSDKGRSRKDRHCFFSRLLIISISLLVGGKGTHVFMAKIAEL